MLSGTVKAGVYTVAQVAGHTGEGEATANAGVTYVVTVEGVSPNKSLQGQWEMLPVSLNARLELVRNSDEKVIAKFEFSHEIWQGWTGDKHLLISQPANPR